MFEASTISDRGQEEKTRRPAESHGHGGRRRTGRVSPEYGTWGAMIARCTNPKNKSYARYGGASITVCDRWRNSFLAFLADMGPKPTPQHTIDRIERTKGYEPGNCRWSTLTEQAHNLGKNLWIEANGRRLCLSDWARETGTPIETLHSRIHKLGWDPARAVTTPLRGRGWNKGRGW